MKSIIQFSLAIGIITGFITSSCKKSKSQNISGDSCGCSSAVVAYTITGVQGNVSYFTNNNKWIISYDPSPGFTLIFIPCNTAQDSLRAITDTASHNSRIQVRFSGKIKPICPNENFGIVGNATFNYLVIDSLKRN